jgi:hypothetical protein
MDIQSLFLQYWLVLAIILALLLYKLFFRIFGIIIIPENRIGLVTKKFVLVVRIVNCQRVGSSR